MIKMRTRYIGIPILAGIFVLSAIVVLAGNSGTTADIEIKSKDNSKSLTSHAPIYVDGNSDFSDGDEDGVSNPSATGTAEDPYIIQNWDINAGSAGGIGIRDTNKYFIIRNCIIHDSKNIYHDGIYFNNVTNGKIDNVTSYNNYRSGIELWYSSNNNITNCAVYNNSEMGVELASSNNNMLTNCAVYSNSEGGIYLHSSSNNITNCAVYNNSKYGIYLDGYNGPCKYNQITNCAIYNNYDFGIFLYHSSNNNVRSNIFLNDGIAIWGSSLSHYIHSISNSTVNSKPLYYYLNQTDILIDSIPIGQLILVNCSQFNIRNITISNASVGIEIAYSSNNNITNCAVYNNSEGGIELDYSPDNQIHYNNIYNNSDYGVYSYPDTNDATHNWWGSASGPYHSTNPSGTGNQVNDNVLYSPWLTELWETAVTRPPEITSIDAVPQIQEVYGYVNITCTVTDNVGVNVIKVNVTGPAYFISVNTTMTRITGTDNYYYNTTYFIPGTYYYFIGVNDTSANQNISVAYSFAVFIPAIIEPVNGTNITAGYTGYGNLSVSIVTTPPQIPSNLSGINIFVEITAPPTMNVSWIYIKVPYNESLLPADVQESTLRLYYWTGSEWRICNNTGIYTVNNFVWANVTHLTIFAPMAEKVVNVETTPLNWFLYIGLIAVIVIALAGVGIGIKRRKKALPPEKPKKEPKPEPLPPQKLVEKRYPEVITCDYCNQTIVIPKEKPSVVKCHICGKKITVSK